MKQLRDCEQYYKDVFTTSLSYTNNRPETDRNRITAAAELETMQNVMRFIYGAEFDRIALTWNQEALNDYYGAMV